MFSSVSRRLLQTNRAILHRAPDPEAANTKMRTGPTYFAATAIIIGLGTAYFATNLAEERGAKKEVETQTGMRRA